MRLQDQPPLDFTYDISTSREKTSGLGWKWLVMETLIGLIFKDGNVNAHKYLDLVNNKVVPEILNHGRYNLNQNGSISRIWWFQDGVSSHTALIVRHRLNELFPQRVVSLHHDVEWPPHSPDLTPLDFFLWGYIKSRVYQTPPADLEELRQKNWSWVCGVEAY